jgi:hypothetical protein
VMAIVSRAQAALSPKPRNAAMVNAVLHEMKRIVPLILAAE